MRFALHMSHPQAVGRATSHVFDLRVDVTLPDRGVTAIWGASGAGKSTLLRAVAGLTRARGHVSVGGQVWQDDASGQWLPVHQRPLGMVFQEASLFPHLNVLDNLRYGWRRAPGRQQGMTPEQAASLLDLQPLLQRRPQQLSGGECQRVALGRALLTQPSLMLLDEPLTGLDITRKAELMPYLASLAQQAGVPMLYVTHAGDEVARLADHLLVLAQGQVQAQGPVADVLSRLDTPWAQWDDAFVVLEAQLLSNDTREGVSHWHVCTPQPDQPPLSLWANPTAAAAGSRQRVRVLARDVSLSLSPAADSSILNSWPARIDSMVTHAQGRVLLRLALAPQTHLLARLTQRSVDKLGLRNGQVVYAQVKGAALLDDPALAFTPR